MDGPLRPCEILLRLQCQLTVLYNHLAVSFDGRLQQRDAPATRRRWPGGAAEVLIWTLGVLRRVPDSCVCSCAGVTRNCTRAVKQRATGVAVVGKR
jgi:hypothetical protein